MASNNYHLSFLTKLLVLALIINSPWAPARAMSSCSQAVEYLMPCQSFLMGIGEITPTCCQGAQALAKATVSSPADRKYICQCLKQIALSVNVNEERAKELPQLCNIKVLVPIQPNVNCDTVQLNYALNRYKNLEIKAFRPTTPGPSPGIGHDSSPGTPHRH